MNLLFLEFVFVEIQISALCFWFSALFFLLHDLSLEVIHVLMAKTKKNRNGGQGPAQNQEVDPILAAALARPESSSRGGARGKDNSTPMPSAGTEKSIGTATIACAKATSSELDKLPEVSTELFESHEQDSEGDNPLEESENASQTLGDEDSSSTSGVRQNARLNSVNDQGIKKQPWSSLFSGNRQPSQGSKLEFFLQDDGPVKIEEEDIQGSDFFRQRSLVGYFGGRFPGKQALRQIMGSWKVQVTTQHHGSGWIIFQFSSIEDQIKVLENGPYIIYGRPLLLKTMPRFFRFENEAISTFPVWIQLRNFPTDLWYPNVFGKICSKLGKPIHSDKMTTHKERVTFARCLVEINMANEIKHSVLIHLPGGGEYEQPVFYENLPRYCPHCKIVGHTEDGCKVKKTISNKNALSVPAGTVAEMERESDPIVAKVTSQSGSIGTEKSNGTHTQFEWVTKKSKAANSHHNGTQIDRVSETSTGNQFSLLGAIPEMEEEQQHISEDVIEQAQSNPKQKQQLSEAVSVQPQNNPKQQKQPASKTVPEQSQSNPEQQKQQSVEAVIEQPQSRPKQKKTQVGGEIYIQQAVQIASGELKSKLHQIPKGQSGDAATIQKKGATQITKKLATATTIAARIIDKSQPASISSPSTSNPPPLAKKEEVKKKRDKKTLEKSGQATSLAEFCADLGGDSPIQPTQ